MNRLLKQTIKKFSGLIVIAIMIAYSTLATGDYVGFIRNLIQFSWLLVPLAVLIILTPMWPSIKGCIGERRVRKELAILDPEKYKILNNVFLRLEDGRTSQIDHVIISEYGIFVIETKNHAGWIFGSEKSEYWTQKIYRSSKKFKNPLRQNYGHMKALMEFLGIDKEEVFHSFIVFSGSAELKKMDAQNVLNLYQLLSHIYTKQIVRLTTEQVVTYEQQLKDNKPAAHNEMKQHVSAINKKVANAGRVCPKCGSVLAQRNGKYGAFMGCTGYPKCRYIYKGESRG